ncbi:PLP-dependent decarboxylase [Burkholderia sp. Bp8963]|uniref:PLP-dependent decarboxylase n=1 Tax=Burkholderia sp. Bp8963 TaxID=2184547 RepID=UPI000F5A04CA|nr:PLP-dependent decarboxylase [Burkholderia sp. Bp8963]RQS64121.1 PLP-dependent decarboxylase [Burkholderia sp. Bp8963]
MTPHLSIGTLDTLQPAALETPCYLFDPAVVIEDLNGLRDALGGPVIVSLKASPVLDLIVRCNHAFGDGVEIASLGELNLTVGRINVPRIVNTPALDAPLVAAALASRAMLVADSPFQVDLIEAAAAKARASGRPAPAIVLRLNAMSVLERRNVPADHFGMDLRTVHRVLDRFGSAASGVTVAGLHVFAGSLTFGQYGIPLAEALARIVPDLCRYPAAPLESVTIGAGLPGDWRTASYDFAAYRAALEPLRARLSVKHEAGRAVFARSGVFATRVVAVKDIDGRGIVVCDGGIAHCFPLAQTEQIMKRWRTPWLVRASDAQVAPYAAPRMLAVVGNSCNRADMIGELQATHAPQPGDLLVFEDCGAYHTYSPTGFLNLRQAQRYIAS